MTGWELRIHRFGLSIAVVAVFLTAGAGLGAAQSCNEDTFTKCDDWTDDGTTDRVKIIDSNENARPDMRGDVWLFDEGADGEIELLIRFKPDTAIETQFGTYRGTAALLYDDLDGDGSVSYRRTVDGVNVTEADSWSAAVVRQAGDSWRSSSHINYRYSILSDREPLERRDRLTFGLAQDYQLNGEIHRVIESYDSDTDGVPDAQISRLEYETVVSRATAQIYHGETPPIERNETLYFPLLAKQNPDPENFYSFRGPPITMDWQRGQINTLRNILSVDREGTERHNARNQEFQYGERNKLYFEIPFNRYDLANDSDGYGELVVNSNYEGARRTVPIQGPPFLNTRYAWDQDNDNLYDYRINYISIHQYQRTVELQPFTIASIPYTEYPGFVTSKSHRGAVFVDANGVSGGGRGGSEGLYNGQDVGEIRHSIWGQNSSADPEHFVPPVIGWRSEYAIGDSLSGQLYLSPIDGELHLRNADRGRWIIDGTPSNESILSFDYSEEAQREGVSPELEIRYRDQNNDGYIDTWSRYSNNELQSRLVYVNQFLVFYDAQNGELGVKRIEEQFKTWEGRAPSSPEEWNELQSVVSNQSTTYELKDIYTRYSGELVAIENTEVDRIDPTDDGVHVSADLTTQSQIIGTTVGSVPDSNEIVLDFKRENQTVGVYHATSQSVSIVNYTIADGEVTPLEDNRLEVTIRNDGWQTAQNVTVALTNDGRVIKKRTVPVIGKQVRDVELQWWPESDHTDTSIEVRTGSEMVAMQPLAATSEPRTVPSILARYGIANRSVPLTLGLGLAVGFGLIIMGRRIFR